MNPTLRRVIADHIGMESQWLKFFVVCLVLISILYVDTAMARKAHNHIVENDAFFGEFLERFKAQKDASQDYCEVRKIHAVYLYQICFIKFPRGVPSRQTMTFIYHKPVPVFWRLSGDSSYYFSEYHLGVSPKVINKDFIVIYENNGWD